RVGSGRAVRAGGARRPGGPVRTRAAGGGMRFLAALTGARQGERDDQTKTSERGGTKRAHGQTIPSIKGVSRFAIQSASRIASRGASFTRCRAPSETLLRPSSGHAEAP